MECAVENKQVKLHYLMVFFMYEILSFFLLLAKLRPFTHEDGVKQAGNKVAVEPKVTKRVATYICSPPDTAYLLLHKV